MPHAKEAIFKYKGLLGMGGGGWGGGGVWGEWGRGVGNDSAAVVKFWVPRQAKKGLGLVETWKTWGFFLARRGKDGVFSWRDGGI